MTSYINFELSENAFRLLVHALENRIEMSSDYPRIREYINVLDSLETQYDQNAAEYTKELRQEIEEQNFRQYLIDNKVIDKELLKMHYMEFLKQNENK